jgi:hypothetical protein
VNKQENKVMFRSHFTQSENEEFNSFTQKRYKQR